MQQMKKRIPTIDMPAWIPFMVTVGGALLVLLAGTWNLFVSPEFGLKPLDAPGLFGLACLYVLVVGTIALLRESK